MHILNFLHLHETHTKKQKESDHSNDEHAFLYHIAIVEIRDMTHLMHMAIRQTKAYTIIFNIHAS